jgi:hypothetical protein
VGRCGSLWGRWGVVVGSLWVVVGSLWGLCGVVVGSLLVVVARLGSFHVLVTTSARRILWLGPTRQS